MTYYASREKLHFFFFQAEDGIRDLYVTGVQTCALPISARDRPPVAAQSRDRSARAFLHRGGARSPERAHSLCRWPGARQERSEERRVGKECRSRWAPVQ